MSRQRKPKMGDRLEYLKAALREIASQCEDVARMPEIGAAERRTWLTVALCARNYAAEKRA